MSTVNSQSVHNPSTSSRMENRPSQNIPTAACFTSSNNHNSNHRDCECCSDEELAEISEKRQSILNADLKDLFKNSKKVKLEDDSSDSSFEEVAAGNTSKQSDDDWQFVENDKHDDKDCTRPLNPGETVDKIPVSNVTKSTRRKSDSSLLNLKKSLSNSETLCNSEIANIHISCKKCGKSRSKITEELLKLNEQLKSSNRSEDEITAKILQFIDYLDEKLESSEQETNGMASSSLGPSTSTSTDQNVENLMSSSPVPEPVQLDDSKIDNQPSCSFDTTKRFINLDDIHSR